MRSISPLEIFTLPGYARGWIKSSGTDLSYRYVGGPCALEKVGEDLGKVLRSPLACSRRWIWEQYDSHVGADTVFGPGQADAAVVRIHGTNQALAMTTDCTARYCLADPFSGSKQAVAEAWRNLTAVGAQPLAVTNNLNFGNPEKPEIMGQFVGCIEGISEACRTLEFPVVSGNVSLYNESTTQTILPTPVIGGLGLLQEVSLAMDLSLKAPQEVLFLIGQTSGHLEQSLYLHWIEHQTAGAVPPVTWDQEQRHGDFIRDLIHKRLISACHDLSDGGLILAVIEMALSSDLGLVLEYDPEPLSWIEFLWGEDQARYIIASPLDNRKEIQRLAQQAEIPLIRLGMSGGSDLVIRDRQIASIADLKRIHEESDLKRALAQ